MTFAACLLSVWVAEAQSFRITELPNQSQLPVANVRGIMQDREGFMWYATEGGGLCRDDGYRVEVFRADKNHPALLASNDITALAEDREGCIWFGTTRGAYVLNKKDYSLHRIEGEGLTEAGIRALLATADSSVWVSVGNRAFRCQRKEEGGVSVTGAYTATWQKKPREIVNFYEEPGGSLWAVLGGGGLLRFDARAGGFAEMSWMPGFAPNNLCAGEAVGEHWVATWGQGIVLYRPDVADGVSCITPQPASVGKDGYGSFRSQVFNVRYDRHHRLLWASAMDDLYAYRVEGDSLVPYPTEGFLPDGKKILDKVTFDRRGSLWVPGYSPHTFIVHEEKQRFHRDSVKAMSDATGYRVMVDRIVREDGRYCWIWQGRTNLSLYDAQEQVMVFTADEASPAPFVTDKCMERRCGADGIWTCSGRRLLRVYHRGMEVCWSAEEAVKVGENIRTLCDDGRGTLYVGTDDALYGYDYDRSVCRVLADGLGVVRDIEVSADETVYFVSDKQGLCRLSHVGKAQPAQQTIHPNPVSPGGYCALAAAPDGTLWIGSSQGNVYRYKPGTDTEPEDDEKAGNRNGDAVKNILVDALGHVWVLADTYLKEYNPSTGAFRRLGSDDAEINMDYFHTMNLDGDQICLGGIGAFCLIPSSVGLSDEACFPKVTSWVADGERHLSGIGEAGLAVGSEVERLELFVSTFDFLHAGDIQFAYRMDEGQEWMTLPKGENRIVLDGLSWGETLLDIAATDVRGVRQPFVTRVIVHRACPPVVTGAVCLVVFLFIIGVVVVVYGVRRRRQKVRSGRPLPTGKIPEGQPADDSLTAQANRQAEEAFLRKAGEVVSRNLDNAAYSVEQFSSDMCMSRMNLYRKLQSLTAHTPSEFIREIRLERAAELMRDTDMSLAEITDRVGFGTSRHFGKCFKDKYGVPPSQYRSSLHENGKRKEKPAEQM